MECKKIQIFSTRNPYSNHFIFQSITICGKKYFRHFWTRAPSDNPMAYFLLSLRPVTRRALISLLLAVLCSLPASGQAKRKVTGTPMLYSVEADGDTVFHDELDPVWVFPKGRGMKRGDWRQYYKQVYYFNRVYPYALVGRKMMAQVDSTIAADASKRSQRNKYVNDVEKELFRLFEKDIRNMTINEGVVLLRLVDRECGMSGYEIIKNYESGFAAGFWQLVAKLFSQDLKAKYDPKGRDAKLEEMVQIWDSGQWNAFYYSIFMEYPQKTVISTDRLKSEVRK